MPEEDTSTARAEPEPIEILHMGTFADGKSVHGAAEVFDILRTRFRQARWAFRGHTDEYWSLSPSIERISHPDHATLSTCEEYLRREFRRRAHDYVTDLPPKDDHLEWLALMQHHGVPTRLMDWTESPYVAAFFAAFDKPDPFKIRPALSTTVRPTRSAIWAVDLDVLDGEARRILQTGGYDFLGEDLDCKKNFQRVFLNEIEDLPAIIASVKPFRKNERLTIQQGMFLCPNTLHVGFESILEKMLRPAYESGRVKSQWLYKLSFDTTARLDILRELRWMNITYATLFPGLDGFAKSLKTDAEIGAD